MGDFTNYLTESTKQYDYRIKIAGDIDKGFGSSLETALQKFEVVKLSAGKSSPIQETPLDFPYLKNTNVTIFELATHYPVSSFELAEYIANQMNITKDRVVVRKPGEPTEEYQADMNAKKDESEFKAVLQDLEYKDAPEVPKEKEFGDKANASLLKELLKDRQEKFEVSKGADNETQKIMATGTDTKTGSPIHTGKAPIKGNPDPIEHYKFKSIGAKA